MNKIEEQEFIAQLQSEATRETAFRKLVQLYSKPLYRHIRYLLIDHDDTNDVLQNTMIKVFRYINDFRGESKLLTWIHSIATNEAISFLNKKTKRSNLSVRDYQTHLLDGLQADSYFDPDPLTVNLHKAIATLPPKQQLVFKMRYFDECKYEEMAIMLNTSVGALKASYHHAVKKIEDFFNRH